MERKPRRAQPREVSFPSLVPGRIHQTLHDQLPSHCDPPRPDRTHYVRPLIFPRAIGKEKKREGGEKRWPFPRVTSALADPFHAEARKRNGEERVSRFVGKGQLVRVAEDDSTRGDRFSALSRTSKQACVRTRGTRVSVVSSANYLWPVSKKRRLESV